MNVNIVQALNGVAIAAANLKDINSVSILQQMIIEASLLPTTYDGAATSATLFLNGVVSPFNAQNFDANAAVAKQLSISGKNLGA